jgi:hypothetical protein
MDPTTLFGLGVSGFTIAIICVSVLCSLVITVAAIAIPIYFMRKNQQKVQNLMARGTQGEATILALQDTGMFINNNPQVKITLEVRMSMYPTYQVTKTMTVPIIRLSQVQTGAVVQVMVDMSDPTNPEKVGLLLK